MELQRMFEQTRQEKMELVEQVCPPPPPPHLFAFGTHATRKHGHDTCRMRELCEIDSVLPYVAWKLLRC
jgi:hypothetical protein